MRLMKNSLICVIYDSITQAITESQVITPLTKRAIANKHDQIIIISFEKKITEKTNTTIQKLSQNYPLVTCVLFKRPPFLGKLFLWQQAVQLKNFLRTLVSSYTLIARGPFATLIAKQGITHDCLSLIAQARGAAFQEYLYTTSHKTKISQLPCLARAAQLYDLEKTAYKALKHKNTHFFVESVSPALTLYLQTTYQTSASFIPALFDLPEPLSTKKRESYRSTVRSQLAIDQHAPVYAYNGSLKLWQCPQETLQFFKQEWKKNKKDKYKAKKNGESTIVQEQFSHRT